VYQPPAGPPVPFPPLALRTTAPVPAASDFRVDWRSALGPLARVDLNRFLPPYPHQGQGLDAAGYRQTPLVGPDDRFDEAPAAVAQQFLAAQAARQRLADDIYRRLLALSGVPAPVNQVRPGDDDLAPRRWLAQLAVNVVDFIDEDEVSTPFLFYTAQDAGDPAFDPGALTAGNVELPRYWVLGTELPRVVLNEALAEYQRPPRGQAGPVAVNVWAELFNTLPADPPPAGAQPADSRPIPLFIPAAGGGPGYGPYRVVIANTSTTAGGPLLPWPGDNGNVLGVPDVVRTATTDADFAARVSTAADPTVPVFPQLGPQGFILLGPPGTDARGTIAPPLVPGATPWLRSPAMQYSAAFLPPNTLSPDDRRDGLTVLLRRLANPHLPPDPRPAVGGVLNPAYNPYVTVDYLSAVPVNDATTPTAVHASRGKRQPYAADRGEVAPQIPAWVASTLHTFGLPNNPVPRSGHYDWLVHLDRTPTSPMELLHVSGYPPHLLTQRFVGRDPVTGRPEPFGHLVPWFDPGNRLYRLFEFLTAGPRPAGVSPGGRVPGKVNLNTIWDPETLLALCDPGPSNHFTAADVYNPSNPGDPNTVYGRLMALRTPVGAPGPDDRPFLPLATGPAPAPGDGTYPADGVALYPGGAGINDTLLRAATADGGPQAPRLFEVPGAHPYLRNELLTKLFNNVTTRSNVFAVWLTVAFFEVADATTVPVKLGAEVGRAEGRQRRHRMFAVVDRTNLRLFATRATTGVTIPAGQTSVVATVTPVAMSGRDGNAPPWDIRVGSRLCMDQGGEEETVVVTAVTPTSFTAAFTRPHAAGFRIVGRGNPGPWPRYDPAADPEVVPYYSVID
jgi:hypothetical protein